MSKVQLNDIHLSGIISREREENLRRKYRTIMSAPAIQMTIEASEYQYNIYYHQVAMRLCTVTMIGII